MTQRYKTKAELNSKTIRISLAKYALLTEIALKAGVSISEALDMVMEQQGKVIKVSSAQPAFKVAGMPSFKVTGMPVLHVTPQVTTAVNGAGATHSAFKIKPKGGVIHE